MAAVPHGAAYQREIKEYKWCDVKILLTLSVILTTDMTSIVTDQVVRWAFCSHSGNSVTSFWYQIFLFDSFDLQLAIFDDCHLMIQVIFIHKMWHNIKKLPSGMLCHVVF
jgi:hypothetical protein